jgi:hypothetical protein
MKYNLKVLIIDETLKKFIYKHTKDLEIVQRNKKKGKGRSNMMSSNPKLNIKISSGQK